MAGLDRRADRRVHRRPRARDPARRRRRPLLRRRRHRRPQPPGSRRAEAADRQHPAPPARPRRTSSCRCCSRCRSRSCARCAASRPASGSRSRSRPTSRSPSDDARFWEPFTRARVHARQRRDLVAAAAGSARCGRASCCSSAASSPGPRRRSGARSTRRCRPTSSTPRSTRWSAQLAAGPTVTLGLTKWLLHAGRDASLDQHLRNEAFALELSSRTDDFREGIVGVPRAARPAVSRALSDARRATTRLAIDPRHERADAVDAVRAWIEEQRPARVVDAGRSGGRGGGARRAHPRRVRGVVPGVRGARASSCRPGRSRTAGSTSRPRWRARVEQELAPVQPRPAQPARSQPRARPRCSRTAPRSSACGSCRRSCATRRCGASSSASRAPAPTSRRSRRARTATATGGS